MNKKSYVLLTGSTGFLGSYLLRKMISNKFNIITIQRKNSNCWRIKDLKDKYINFYAEKINYDKLFKKYQIKFIIHTACEYGKDHSSILKIFEANFFFGSLLLEKAIKYNVQYFINTDTFYPKKRNLYSLSKKQFVELLFFNQNKIKIINLKIEHLFGPKDNLNKFVPWIINELYCQVKKINIINSSEKRDFIYIDDVVDFYIYIIKNYRIFSKNFYEFNLGTGKLTSIKKTVIKIKKIFESLNGTSNTKIFYKKIPNKSKNLNFKIFSLKKIKWNTKINIDDGLMNTIKDFKNNDYYR